MPDQNPPPLAADERDTLLAMLRFQRESLVRKVSGVDEAAARRSPVSSGTNLLWLVKHLTEVEVVWVARRFAGQDVAHPDATVRPDDTLAAVTDAYRAAWPRVDAVVTAAPSLDEPRRDGGEPPVNLRWIVTHVLEETARHAGHADIIRELIDGRTGR
jgi:uncharacterized damage-inducible protein DinB